MPRSHRGSQQTRRPSPGPVGTASRLPRPSSEMSCHVQPQAQTQPESPRRLTIVCHVEVSGFCPGAVASQGGGPDSHAVIPRRQPTQPAAPLQSKVSAGDTEVQLLQDKGAEGAGVWSSFATRECPSPIALRGRSRRGGCHHG